jgi:hypothetical protein
MFGAVYFCVVGLVVQEGFVGYAAYTCIHPCVVRAYVQRYLAPRSVSRQKSCICGITFFLSTTCLPKTLACVEHVTRPN